MEQIWLMVGTAILSSLFTLGGAVLGYKLFFGRLIDRELDRQADQFEERLRVEFEKAGEALVPEFRNELEAAFRATGQELIPEFSQELEKAFHNAATQLFPEFREEVRAGFNEAMIGAVSGEIVPSAAQRMADKFRNLIGRK